MNRLSLAKSVLVGRCISGWCRDGSGVVDGIGRSAAPMGVRLRHGLVVPWCIRSGVAEVDADGVACVIY